MANCTHPTVVSQGPVTANNVTPPAAPTTYTQTYATAAATVPAAISATLVLSATNIASKTASLTLGQSSATNPTENEFNQLAKDVGTAMNLISADLLAVKKLVNQLIDDLQALGFAL